MIQLFTKHLHFDMNTMTPYFQNVGLVRTFSIVDKEVVKLTVDNETSSQRWLYMQRTPETWIKTPVSVSRLKSYNFYKITTFAY